MLFLVLFFFYSFNFTVKMLPAFRLSVCFRGIRSVTSIRAVYFACILFIYFTHHKWIHWVRVCVCVFLTRTSVKIICLCYLVGPNVVNQLQIIYTDTNASEVLCNYRLFLELVVGLNEWNECLDSLQMNWLFRLSDDLWICHILELRNLITARYLFVCFWF